MAKASGLRRFVQEIGETLSAAVRVGARDMQDVVLNPFPQQHIASHDDPGMPFQPPQQSIEAVEGPAMAPAGKGKEIER